MTRAKTMAVLAMILVGFSGACGEEPDQEIEPTNVIEGDLEGETVLGDEVADVGVPEPVTPVPQTATATAVGSIVPVNETGVEGSITVRSLGTATLISYNVTNVPVGNESLEFAIQTGTCGNPGQPVRDLGPVPVGAGRIVAAADTVPLDPARVLDGRHIFTVKLANAGPETPPAACAEIPFVRRTDEDEL